MSRARASCALLCALACAWAGGARACPAGCSCDADRPALPGLCLPYFTYIEYKPNQQLDIQCDLSMNASSFSWDLFPNVTFSPSSTPLPHVFLHYCPPPRPLSRLLLGLLPGGVRKLTIMNSPAEVQLTEEDVRGLHMVTELRVYWDQPDPDRRTMSAFPAAALARLPALERVNIRGANLTLHAGAMDALASLDALRWLELPDDRLGALPPGTLAPLSRLTRLLLWGNPLEAVSADMFTGLSSVELLSLERTRVTSLPADTFSPLAGLTRLALAGSPLRRVHTDAFRGLHRLQELSLSNNPAGPSSLSLSERALGGMPALRRLLLSRAGLATLPEDVFDGDAALEELLMDHNALRTIPARALHALPSLRTLDVAHNQLVALDSSLLHASPALQVLRLDHNNLTQLPTLFLSGAVSIASLSASHNALGAVSRAALDAPSLRTLDLAHNYINIPSLIQLQEQSYAPLLEKEMYPFNGLTSLRELRLAHNRLQALPPDLTTMLHLTSANLTHNNLTQISATELNFLTSENLTVDLRHNNITTVLLERGERGERGTDAPGEGLVRDNVRVLLADNPLHCDCHLYPVLRRLRGRWPDTMHEPTIELGDAACAEPPELRDARLVSLSPDELVCAVPAPRCPPRCACELRAATRALEMDCSAPPERYPDVSDFTGTEGDIRLHLRTPPPTLAALDAQVTYLDLSDLGLRAPPPGAPTSALRVVDLRDNYLTESPAMLLSRGLSVLLAGNPLECDCGHEEDVRALQHELRARVLDYDNVTCAGGAALRQLSPSQLCATRRAAAAGGALAGLAALLVLVAVLCFYFRLELRVLLYARGWCACLLPREEDDGREYDAFVSFAHEDSQFVITELLPGLEGGARPFRLCVHHRDWVAGEWIPAQIARSVERSRRTIIVLSPRFLDSVWGRLEFRAAHGAGSGAGRSRVLVVLLEDVAGHPELDAELRAYLATNTYLRWGDPWFWERLRYALPHRRDEARVRRRGEALADKLVVGGAGGLNAHLDAQGKIVNTALKAPPTVSAPPAH